MSRSPLGTHPINWSALRSSVLRLTRLPNSDGISPVNWLALRSSDVTLPSASVSTPCHSFKDLSLIQLSLFFQPSPPVARYSDSKVPRSTGVGVLVGDGVGVKVGVGVSVGMPAGVGVLVGDGVGVKVGVHVHMGGMLAASIVVGLLIWSASEF